MDRKYNNIFVQNQLDSDFEEFSQENSDSISQIYTSFNITSIYIIFMCHDLLKKCRELGRKQDEIVDFFTDFFNKDENKQFKVKMNIATLMAYLGYLKNQENIDKLSKRFSNIVLDDESMSFMNRLIEALTDFKDKTEGYQRKQNISAFKFIERCFDTIEQMRYNDTPFSVISKDINKFFKKKKYKFTISESTLIGYYYKIKKKQKDDTSTVEETNHDLMTASRPPTCPGNDTSTVEETDDEIADTAMEQAGSVSRGSLRQQGTIERNWKSRQKPFWMRSRKMDDPD